VSSRADYGSLNRRNMEEWSLRQPRPSSSIRRTEQARLDWWPRDMQDRRAVSSTAMLRENNAFTPRIFFTVTFAHTRCADPRLDSSSGIRDSLGETHSS
jgi:hypothetical protein